MLLLVLMVVAGCVSVDVRGESEEPGEPGEGEGGDGGEDVLGGRHALQQVTHLMTEARQVAGALIVCDKKLLGLRTEVVSSQGGEETGDSLGAALLW